MALDPNVRLMAHILPNSATAYERVLASQVDRLLELDVERSRNLWNPWKCHEDDLPYLAWALSVDIWDTSWPTLKKRSVVANAVTHHKIKGTQLGLETYLGLVDVTVDTVITPAMKVFSGPSLTRQEREAWLSDLPQVRLYYEPEPAQFASSTFSSGFLAKSFVGLDFLVPSTARVRSSRKARYLVDGVEQDVKVAEDDSLVRIMIPGKVPDSIFSGGTLARCYTGDGFFMPSTASQRIVTIAPLVISAWRAPVGPSLEPVSSQPEKVSLQGDAGLGAYSNQPFGWGFYLPSTAGERVFDRYAIDDGRQIRKRPSIQFMGLDRYGMPGHTAEVKVRIRSKRPEIQAGEGTAIPGTTFWLPHDSKPLDRACDAALASKRLSDRILLDTKTPSGFIAGLPFIAGRDEFVV